jgi:hypothetical protein
MEIHTMGIDLGKTVFHLVGLSLRGEVVVRKMASLPAGLHFEMFPESPQFSENILRSCRFHLIRRG